MKKALVFLYILFACCGCAEKQADSAPDSTLVSFKEETTTKLADVDNLYESSKTSSEPCREIQSFVVDIEKMNWVSDTSRLLKTSLYKALDRNQIRFFNKRPFYKIKFQDSQLGYFFRMYKQNPDASSATLEPFANVLASIDFELFRNAKSIWGYFYRDKNATGWMSDGVIEQWEFSTEKEATEALKQLRESAFDVYFNTNPYFCCIENKLIVFHTRAMRFSYDQKAIFDRFLAEKVNERH